VVARLQRAERVHGCLLAEVGRPVRGSRAVAVALALGRCTAMLRDLLDGL
jgi:hypothetical protein